MSDVLEQGYGKLVHEVYIAPIRSVIVVDDDFPTLDGLLAAQSVEAVSSAVEQATASSQNAERNSVAPDPRRSADTAGTLQAAPMQRRESKDSTKDVQRVRDLVALCRNRERPWLVDVHDGKEVNTKDELAIAPYLHHSDLMILDYHLLGVNEGGDRSIAIMRKLAENDHFNLVIVYTSGFDGNIRTVFDEIVTALTPRSKRWVDVERKVALDSLISDWEDEEGEDIEGSLLDIIDIKAYLEELRTPGWILNNAALRDRILALLKACPAQVARKTVEIGQGGEVKRVKLDPKALTYWGLAALQSKAAEKMSASDLGRVDFDFSDKTNWIRTRSLFVTVVNKKEAPKELIDILENALKAWGPVPHQLLMGKMRAQIDERGVIAEGEVLTDKFVQTGWLMETVDGEGDRERAVRHSVERHWEALGDRMRADIEPFASQLFQNLQQREKEDVFKRFGVKGVDPNSSDVFTHLNHFYSTKPVDRSHLTTGHVLELKSSDPKKPPQYWVCLSPACDMVPGQKTGAWRGRLDGNLPFIAVSISKIGATEALHRINENSFLFVRTEAGMEAFTFYPNGDSMNSPAWELMYAATGGKFIEERSAVSVGRTRAENSKLEVKFEFASVICQLRYEYALNLLQRLGSSMSRIGLDFRQLAKVEGAAALAPAAVNMADGAVANAPVMSVDEDGGKAA